jgi:hypothetical protein
MAADAGTAAMAATMPCYVRRKLGAAGAADFAAYGFFPWKGQNIDTPPRVATKWTTDDDTHPVT